MERELTLNEIYRASHVLKTTIRRTSLIVAPSVRKDCEVYIKPENLQVTGSFKVRGATYMISQLSDEEKSRGVIASSAGNHAQGVALAASANGINSIICLPSGAPISKVEATRSYGAEICLVPGVYDDAYRKALQLRDERRMTFVHPFNDPMVIAGQGTIGLEILDDLPDVDAIIVPVGGGGLISGVAYAAKQLKPGIKVYGVQAAGAPSMVRSLEDGHLGRLSSVSTIADGIAVKEPGNLTYDLCSKYVDRIITVSDDEICAAILLLLEKHKLIAEGAGAVSVAAAMFGGLPLEGKKVACVVSGGNVDVTILNRIINRGLQMNGRLCTLSLELADRPGQLVGVSKIISDLGANVTGVLHRWTNTNIDVSSCILQVSMETRDREHILQIKERLISEGFEIVAEE
ncbi:MAG: threonine ammonia-lyase [Bacteroidales bacterium]|nr:threonine ammonia-lyase [Candidatus Cryptobacteroides faecihippi]